MAREPRTTSSDLIASLEGLSVRDLEAVIAAAEQLKDSKRESGKRELLEEFHEKAKALGLSVEELIGRAERSPRGRPKQAPSRKTGPRGPVAAKYRNPETGDTWSGRGRAPRWLTAAEAQGRQRDEFAVNGVG